MSFIGTSIWLRQCTDHRRRWRIVPIVLTAHEVICCLKVPSHWPSGLVVYFSSPKERRTGELPPLETDPCGMGATFNRLCIPAVSL